MAAREWLHRQMNTLVALQIVIAIERLRTLITFEWTIVVRHLLRMMPAIQWSGHLLGICHAAHSAEESHLTARLVNIRHDRCGKGREIVMWVGGTGRVALGCAHGMRVVGLDGGDAVGGSGGGIGGMLRGRLLSEGGERRLLRGGR